MPNLKKYQVYMAARQMKVQGDPFKRTSTFIINKKIKKMT